MTDGIVFISSDADKVECYRLTCEILSIQISMNENAKKMEMLRQELVKKCREIESKAGPNCEINAEFDCVRKNGNDDNH